MIEITQSFKMMDEVDREKLKKVLTIINDVGFICEKIYSKKHSRLVVNENYRFIEYNEDFIRGYLEVADIDLINDNINGVFIAKRKIGRVLRLDKNTSIFLLVIRIIYEEKLREASLSIEIRITLEDILQKCASLGIINTNLTGNVLNNSLRILVRYNVFSKISGAYDDPESRYIIYPTIIHIINSVIIDSILKDYTARRSDEEEISKENFLGVDIDISELLLQEGALYSECEPEEYEYESQEEADVS